MPLVFKTSAFGPPTQLISPTRPWQLLGTPATWYSANSAASLTARTRADQINEPTDNATTGEYCFDPDGSIGLFKFLIRGAAAAISRGNVVTANLWEWSQVTRPGDDVFSPIVSWSPTLVGRWTLTFNSTGSAANNTLGVANSVVLATDLYCSFVAVVGTYDRRNDYALRWKILQPAVEDGSPAVLMVDGLGANRMSWEMRTTTNGDMCNVAGRFTTSA